MQTYGIHSHSHLSLSLTKYTHFLGFTISYVAMVIQTETGRGVCVCVCVRERERERMGGGGGGGKRVCVCVNFVSFAGISTSVKNMSLKRRVLSQRNPDPPSCSHYNLCRHMEYILTLTSLSLTKYTHFLGFTISYVLMVIQTETGRCVCVCVAHTPPRAQYSLPACPSQR